MLVSHLLHIFQVFFSPSFSVTFSFVLFSVLFGPPGVLGSTFIYIAGCIEQMILSVLVLFSCILVKILLYITVSLE